jgi:hypothetical protein
MRLLSKTSKWLDYAESDFYSFRRIAVSVVSKDDASIVSRGAFSEWRSSGLGFNEEFSDAADAVSQQDYDLAQVVASRWSDQDHPLNSGNIVSFDRLENFHAPRQKSAQIWRLIDRFIERRFEEAGSILLLKAFPLEFEGRPIGDCPPFMQERFERRRAAMYRLYARTLGVRRVHGAFEQGGWMWRKLGCGDDATWGTW